ncbi:BREX system P-loop protein BrxC [Filibacter tadaridae]|uniref:BREX system P-loop protein BrxC n=1 Tax=Filibacter tadaridae TaxID=2483811 RepID=A0A3P5WDN4_9BACL|nr:BREX system P-loop protein BrxC [Filibacter tadaridae]VDC19304.1 hypothetical protein FILTAD_00240 [Filibacter tadaridae]
MEIKKMFAKSIERDIKGVIKIGNENDDIHQELDEYVVTNELEKHIGDFFSSYKKGVNGHTDEVGVWISGFFGSGKSHFLKILSYLTGNASVMGQKAITYFDDKIQHTGILDDMKLAGETTKDIILFDIDAKSESDAKNDKNAIVKVMNKAFNEMQGFCGAIPWIADIERQMLKRNEYDSFKETFKEISGNEWIETREDFYYEEDAIIKALSTTTKMSEDAARNWFERAESEYTISIDRFAQRVSDYIAAKGGNHHVLFFIDEIGQYIGEDSQLMLNLQTIIHEFGLKCKGKAWVIVTSQEDYDSFMAVKGNDFSKIQGRFDTKLSLSSAYVDEVITKRLLLKNMYAQDMLTLMYQQKSSTINNLLTFSEQTATMRKYGSEQEFVDVYPFIPYQFNLLQRAITEIANHSNTSKHQSRGERSLLSSFQEAALQYAGEDEGTLVPFSTFYRPMESFLESSVRTVIIHASKNEHLTVYDVEVLKLLFLMKYVKEVPSTLENIATLMVDHIDVDKIELKKKIEKSLLRLAKETLIQKNGFEYIFLTNDEQDVDREIKNIHIGTAEVIQKIGEVLFGNIYTDKKYRHSQKDHFDFNELIDDRPIGSQSHDIGLRIVTPYFNVGTDLDSAELRSISMRETNVIVHLPSDTSYLEEMEEVLKIQSYLNIKSGVSLSQVIEDIKVRKSREVTERKSRVQTFLTEALKSADIYANAQQLSINAKNPVERINEAFKMLINALYHKLPYMTHHIESTKQLQELLEQPSIQMAMLGELEENQLALQELDTYIERLSSRNQPPTVKNMTTHFSKQPYGWNEIDTTGLLIRLYKTQQVKLLLNNSYLQPEDKEMLSYLTKRDYVDRVVVQKRERISSLIIKGVMDLSRDLFNVTALPQDEDSLMETFIHLLKKEKEHIGTLIAHYAHRNYPGEEVLIDGEKHIKELLEIRDTATFYAKVRELRNELKAYATNVEEVKNFFDNQRSIYDRALDKLMLFEGNATYVNDEELLKTVDQMKKVIRHREPYDTIQQLPDLYQSFDDRFVDLLKEECKPIKTSIEEDQHVVIEELELHPNVKSIFVENVRDQFLSLKDRLESVNNFYEAIAMQTESDRLKVRFMHAIQQKLAELSAVPVQIEPEDDSAEPVQPTKPAKKTKTISKMTMLRGTTKIESHEDIDKFLQDLRAKLEAEFDEDTIITLV